MKTNPQTGHAPGTNEGHGHVWPRPDGCRARCGGQAFCQDCKSDHEWVQKQHAESEMDAVRYRWLRTHSVVLAEDQLSFGPGFNQLEPQLLDDVIDEQMRSSSGSENRKRVQKLIKDGLQAASLLRGIHFFGHARIVEELVREIERTST